MHEWNISQPNSKAITFHCIMILVTQLYSLFTWNFSIITCLYLPLGKH